MILAGVLATCEDQFICDMAQTYKIYDYKGLSPSYVATLCLGLPENSRVKKKINKQPITLVEMELALLIDGVNILIWQKTKDGSKGRNKPESLFKKLLGMDKKPKEELEAFKDAEDFEKWYKDKHK